MKKYMVYALCFIPSHMFLFMQALEIPRPNNQLAKKGNLAEN